MEIDEAKAFQESNNIEYRVETSAKNGDNSSNVFLQAAKALYKNYLIYDKMRSNSKTSRLSELRSLGNSQEEDKNDRHSAKKNGTKGICDSSKSCAIL